jgi:hypothetical protein
VNIAYIPKTAKTPSIPQRIFLTRGREMKALMDDALTFDTGDASSECAVKTGRGKDDTAR